jgi:parallel beta-helix repeat protein
VAGALAAPILSAVTLRKAALALLAACLAAFAVVSASPAGSAAQLYVSPQGVSGAAGVDCSSAAYSTIQAAVDAAAAGGTVIVCKGSYKEDVVISTPLKLMGQDGAVIHGSPTANAMCDQNGFSGPGHAPCLAGITVKSSHVRVQGLTVTGAIGEGILVTGSLAGRSIGQVVIRGNRVIGNDTDGQPGIGGSPYPTCNPHGEIPGDCGEGIHLMGVHDSIVSHNTVKGNSGGILLSDELGPTYHNKVGHNVVLSNLWDCGVTVVGHSPHALDANGNPQPSVGGVYENVIFRNRIVGNGMRDEGAGVLFANAMAGTASYHNLVSHNFIEGNEMAGVTMHAHPIAAGTHENLSGNRVVGNTIGPNNLGGDPDAFDCAFSCRSHKLLQTTGVLVYGAVPVTVRIAHNHINQNEFGIWLGSITMVKASLQQNKFRDVVTSVVRVR